jgi:hypothetical protein
MVIFVFAELFLYFFNPQLPGFVRPDPLLGTMHFPNYTLRQNNTCIQASTHFNTEGMNDVDHTIEKPQGVYRIAVIGDSYVEAIQLPLRHAYFKVLENELQSKGYTVEVLAFGVGGFGTLQEYYLLRDYAFKYKPDLVVLSFLTYNDVRNNSLALERSLDMPYATLDTAGHLHFEPFHLRGEYVKAFESPLRSLLFDRSHLIRFIYRLSNHSATFRNALARLGLHTPTVVGQESQDTNDELYFVEQPLEWEKAWNVTEALIRKTKEDTESHQAQFMLFSLSNDDQLSKENFSRIEKKYPRVQLDPELPEKRLVKFTQKENIPYLSALPSMKKLFERGIVVHPACHGHWSKEASKQAGIVLSEFVVEHFLEKLYNSE